MDLIIPFDLIDFGLGHVESGVMNGAEYHRSMFIIDTADFDGTCSWKFQVVAKNTTGSDQVITLKRITNLEWDPDDLTTVDEEEYTIPSTATEATLINFDFAPTAGDFRYFWSIPDVNGLVVYTGRPVLTQTGATKTVAWRPLVNREGPGTPGDHLGSVWGSPSDWEDSAYGGTFYWNPSLYDADTVSLILEATVGSTYGGITIGIRLFDVTANQGVAATEFTIDTGGAFRYPQSVCDRLEFAASALIAGHLYTIQFRRDSVWGGGVTTNWLSNALLERAALLVKLNGNIAACEVAYRVAKPNSGPTTSPIGTSRAIVELPAGQNANYIKNETCSKADFDYAEDPESDFWITDDGLVLSGDASSATNVPNSNAHQNPTESLLPIFSVDWKSNFITGDSYCSRWQASSEGGDADSIWTLIVIGYITSSAPSPGGEVGGAKIIEYFGPHELFAQIADAFFVHCGLTIDGGAAVDITSITNANPAVVTAPGHTFVNGDKVRIADVSGMTEANNEDETTAYTVAGVSGDTFQLSGTDSSAWRAYSSLGTATKVTNAVSGLPTSVYYDGKVIKVLGDGQYIYAGPVDSGAATLPFYANKIHAGLPFTTIIEPMNPNAGSSQGTARGKKQKINRVTMCFHETNKCKVGINQDLLYDLPGFEDGVLFSGDMIIDLQGEWEDKATISIVHDEPLPLTVKAVVPHVNINEPSGS